MKGKRVFLHFLVATIISVLFFTGLAQAETRLNAYWAHGNSFIPEFPFNIAAKTILGWGTYFYGKENTYNWFHISIPTPVIVENTRTKIKKVFVLFKTIGYAKITDVHIYDGKKKLKAFSGLSLSGDHTVIDAVNQFNMQLTILPPSYPPIYGGINVCVRVEFGPKYNSQFSSIWFPTAGAEFNRTY